MPFSWVSFLILTWSHRPAAPPASQIRFLLRLPSFWFNDFRLMRRLFLRFPLGWHPQSEAPPSQRGPSEFSIPTPISEKSSLLQTGCCLKINIQHLTFLSALSPPSRDEIEVAPALFSFFPWKSHFPQETWAFSFNRGIRLSALFSRLLFGALSNLLRRLL